MMNCNHDSGEKVAQAYGRIIKYTSVDSVNKPVLVFGSAPIDETIYKKG